MRRARHSCSGSRLNALIAAPTNVDARTHAGDCVLSVASQIASTCISMGCFRRVSGAVPWLGLFAEFFLIFSEVRLFLRYLFGHFADTPHASVVLVFKIAQLFTRVIGWLVLEVKTRRSYLRISCLLASGVRQLANRIDRSRSVVCASGRRSWKLLC